MHIVGGVTVVACGCSLLIDFIFPVKWEVRSSAQSKDGRDVGGLRGEKKV